MKVFIAGGTGAVGKRLVPLLASAGHDVYATTRSAGKVDDLRRLGAEPVVLDILDREAVEAAIAAARPEVIVHQATALADMSDFRHFAEEFAQTDRLRTEGTDNLLAAAAGSGVRRVVAQSFTGWPYARVGGPVKTEDDPLDPDPPEAARGVLAAIRHVEERVTETPGLEGVALRYGGFYGPGTSLTEGGVHLEAVRKRKFPVVGGGHRDLVVRPHRRRRHGDEGCDRERRDRHLQRRRRRAGAGVRVAPVPRRRDRRQAAAARPRVGRPARRRRARARDDDHVPRRLEREGQARARLAAPLPELAARLQGRARRRAADSRQAVAV